MVHRTVLLFSRAAEKEIVNLFSQPIPGGRILWCIGPSSYSLTFPFISPEVFPSAPLCYHTALDLSIVF